MLAKSVSFIVVAVIAVVIASVILINISSLFIWYLLPQGDGLKVVVNSCNESDKPIAAFRAAFGSEEVIEYMQDCHRVGVGISDGVEVIIVQPLLRHQWSIGSRLENSGWKVERIGLLVAASRSAGGYNALSVSSMVDAAYNALAMSLTSNTPLDPSLIASTKLPEGYDDEGLITIVGSSGGGQLKVLIGEDIESLLSAKRVKRYAPDDGLYVALPSHIMSLLPLPLQSAWNSALIKRFGFTAISPEMITYLSQFEEMNIRISDEDALIAVVGPLESVMEGVSKWLEEEEGRRKPKRKAFKLPDGTLGYEQVPSQVGDIIQLEEDGCYQAKNSFIKIRVCSSGDRVFISTNEQWIKDWKSVVLDESGWTVSMKGSIRNIGGEELPDICQGARQLTGFMCELMQSKEILFRGNSSENSFSAYIK